MSNLINIVGIGPGTRDFITPLALKLIDSADILIGGQRNLELFSDLEKEKFIIKNNLREMVLFIKDKYKSHKITLIASGDPGLFGIVSFMSKNFDEKELKVLPGVSSVQLAFARLKMPWQDAVILSAHGRELDTIIDLLISLPKVAVLTDSKASPSVIADELQRRGVRNKAVWVCANLSYPDEIVQRFTVEELAKFNSQNNCVLVLVDI